MHSYLQHWLELTRAASDNTNGLLNCEVSYVDVLLVVAGITVIEFVDQVKCRACKTEPQSAL